MPTILIADDSPVARHLLATRLRREGVTVVEVENARDAVLVDPHSIDVALLDLDLGDGDGVSVAEVFLAKRPDLPFAFFSSETEGAIFLQAKALTDVFSKEDVDGAVAWAISQSTSGSTSHTA